ncbi:Crp/Fnr family transcriptional regulator [Brevibacillus borstelensis]|jgi:CRP/FNR family transcriptional regulator|uniref:Crp/Fnr family transcriptional regulator n=1 Tax=Brevibacillus thermoruber TaxID=33942 RepID=A0A9X3Z2K8_9BACL|nr:MULTISPECIES: Crp/Fnr family transcriptional regulator [Brevibacillus]MDA5107881.1 Crp/Fnr family transcriptional regulator [Brevibacillus thermoruber]MED1747060.1 Crp/Fnr family transcriptional regulator [Brevibacillus borstelensis]MED1876683.1 Crp/Fnr family transcriptional regulator [Brevibacillus borstelensis]MED1885754.1 Crp/Fnr family transcriptional regulator [Brevibacillus borstelensis]RNB56366.1 Crp/Fnr family transcriptional regulator [Brevibacillus borstelensis]
MRNGDCLQQVPLFRDLNRQELARVEEITMHRLFRKKTTIFMEGSEKEAVFFIQDGLVKAYKTDEEGHEQIVSLLQTGDMFPHTGFFTQTPYPATTEALVDTHVLTIPVHAFEQLILSMPSIAIKVIDVMGAKIRELQQKLQQFTGHDVHGRIAFFLLQLADKHGEVNDSRVYIELPMTHQELANAIGSSRETVNRLVNQLKKQRILDTHRSGIIILDKDALKRWGEQ